MKRLAIIGLVTALGLLLLCLVGGPTSASTSTLTGAINDAQGNPLNGSITMQLPVPAQDTTTNTAVANTIVRYKVVNGAIQSGPPLYDVANLQPANLYYITKVYDPANNLVMSANYVVTGASFNLGAATPTAITTSNISYVTPVTTSVSNTFTQPQAFPAVQDSATPVAATGFIRINSGDAVCWRNSANSGDVCMTKNASDQFLLSGDLVATLTASQTMTNKTFNVPLPSGTGLQIFNTPTTCTTAASAGATCTTAAISLPVAEADTAYRITCTGKGITNVPVVIATTNSSATQFTITIAALTAAAATFTSYDCIAGHN